MMIGEDESIGGKNKTRARACVMQITSQRFVHINLHHGVLDLIDRTNDHLRKCIHKYCFRQGLKILSKTGCLKI